MAAAVTHQGDWREGRRIAQETLAQARELGLRPIEGKCLNLLAVIAGNTLNDFVAALEFDQQCFAINREVGDKSTEAIALTNVGVQWMNLGNLVQARRLLEEGLQLARTNGERVAEGGTLVTLSGLALWQGDGARALDLARAAHEIAVAVEARDKEAMALLSLGSAELALQRLDDAERSFEKARAVGDVIEAATGLEAIGGLARVALARDDSAAALKQVERIVALLEAGATLERVEYPRMLEWTCYQAFDRAHDARADAWLTRAYTRVRDIAATISDAKIQAGFLVDIPEHREIVKAWAARYAAVGPTTS